MQPMQIHPEPTDDAYPVDVIARYPERSSRGLALLAILFFIKTLLLLPHLVVMWFLGIAMGVVAFIGYWAVLIVGYYPRGLWNFAIGVLRWNTRISAWLLGLTDKYPPFSLD